MKHQALVTSVVRDLHGRNCLTSGKHTKHALPGGIQLAAYLNLDVIQVCCKIKPIANLWINWKRAC